MGFFSASGRGRSAGFPVEPDFEALESRLVLYQGPMISGAPPIGSLENPNDTVVRVDTNVGKFDLEMFDSLAPVTVANFLNYVKNGRFDESIFHALTPGLLYGGRTKFTDGSGPSLVTPFASIPNGFSRSNLTGTITMVPTSSTTTANVFGINLANNTSLNTASGGYTVFGKVIQGMSVLQAIAGYATQDFNSRWGSPTPGPYYAVPVTPAYNGGTGPTEATLIRITDVEITKAHGITRYYEQSYVMSEGVRTATSVERIDLVNLETNFANNYQIILHYQSGADRDQVIATGVLAVGARNYVKINDLGSLVHTGINYSIEVRATRAMGVSLDQRETGYTMGESFLMETRVFESQLKLWNFGQAVKGSLDQTTIAFGSLTDQNINVYMLIYPEGGGAPTFYGTPLKALRRGTLNLASLGGLADGNYSIQISSTGPIIASIAHTKTGGGGNASDGDLSLGVTSAGRTEGYLAAAMVPTGGESHIDLFYSAGSPAAVIVDLVFTLNNGTEIGAQRVLTAASPKMRVDLSSIAGLPTDTYFSVRYASQNATTPITATYEAEVAGDSMSTPFMTMTTRSAIFADGYTDPTLTAGQESETVSIFNPYATDVGFRYDLLYHFSDGTVIFASGGPSFTLAAHHRVDYQARDIPAVMTKINSNANFRFYSVEVVTVQFTFPTPVGGVIAQMTRLHNTWGQSMTTGPSMDERQPMLFMENAEFH